MERMLVATGIRCEPSTDGAPIKVDRVGFSLVHMMKLSGGAATGVRAELQIEDPEALEQLERYYQNNTELRWHFTFGGGGRSISVPLRWTKFDRDSGYVQVVRTAVMRDLLDELDSEEPDTQMQEEKTSYSLVRKYIPSILSRTHDREVPSTPTAPADRTSEQKSNWRLGRSDLSNLWSRFI